MTAGQTVLTHDYEILYGTLVELRDLVNEAIKQGYRPQGGPFETVSGGVSPLKWGQAVLKIPPPIFTVDMAAGRLIDLDAAFGDDPVKSAGRPVGSGG